METLIKVTRLPAFVFGRLGAEVYWHISPYGSADDPWEVPLCAHMSGVWWDETRLTLDEDAPICPTCERLWHGLTEAR